MKNKWLYWCGLITLIFLCLPATAWAADNPVGVSYRGHIQDLGDYPREGSWVDSPEMIGTVGQSKRIEGFEVKLTGTVPEGMELRYNVHVQNKGWLYDEDDSANWPKDGAYAGTRGDSLRIEAVKIVLTDSAGKAVTGYSVQYRGHVQNVGDLPADKTQWLADGAQLGTVGSSLRLEALLVQVVKTGTDPVEPTETTVYDRAGTYGPDQDSETIAGDVTIAADGVVLQNLVIAGNLTISEAVGDGNVTLNNVTVKGDTFVRGGGIHSIKINGGKYSRIIMEKTASGAVRIMALNVDGIPFIVSEAAAGETIILEGAFESVTVNAPNMTVTTQGATTIGKMTVSAEAAGSTVTVAAGTTVTDLVLDGKTAIKGQGNVAKAEVKADGVVFDKKPGAVTVEPDVVIPPVFPTPDSGGSSGGGSTPPGPIVVTAVSLNKTDLILSFNDNETLAATVAPADAANKTVAWTTSDDTIATVDANGKVTGSANKEGTATITVTSADGAKSASCIVTVTRFKLKIADDGTGIITGMNGSSTDIVIPETIGGLTITSIGVQAFQSSNISAVAIPKTVKTIGNFAFDTCSDLDSVTFAADSNLETIGSTAFFHTEIRAVSIPQSVKTISNNAFNTCRDLASVTFAANSNLETIGVGTFADSGVCDITLPEKVKAIPDLAFSGCYNLSTVTLPSGLTAIGAEAFNKCPKLTAITIPKGVISIGKDAFGFDAYNAPAYRSYTFRGDVPVTMGAVAAVVNPGAVIPVTPIPTIRYYENYTGFTTADWAGYTKAVILAKPVLNTTTAANTGTPAVNLSWGTVANATGYEVSVSEHSDLSAAISISVTEAKAIISTGLTAGKSYYFAVKARDAYGVSVPSDIKSVPIPSVSITKVTLNPTNLTVGVSKTAKLTAEVLPANAQVTSVTWASSDQSIATVDNTGQVKGVKEGSASITATAVNAVGSTTSTPCAVTVTTSFEVTQIEDGIGMITGMNGSSTNIAIPETIGGLTITAIGNTAFEDSGIADVEIPKSVKTIGNDAFNNCTSLTMVTFAPESILETIGIAAFAGCGALSSVTLPSALTTIGAEAFKDCTYLGVIEIPKGVVSIGADAFSDCKLNATTGQSTLVLSFDGNAPGTVGTTAFPAGTTFAYWEGKTGFDTAPWKDSGFTLKLRNAVLTQTAATINTASFSFAAQPGATEVKLQQKVSTDSDWSDATTEALTTASTTATAIGLSSGTGYNFRLLISDGDIPRPSQVVNLTTDVAVTGVGLNRYNLVLSLNGSSTLAANVLPTNATNNNLNWTSSNSIVASVKPYGEVSAKSVGTATITATAADGSGKSDSCLVTVLPYSYSEDSEQVTITNYLGSAATVAIPETIGGKPVVAIGASAFASKTTLTEVTIPATVTTIAEDAFKDNPITTITIPANVTIAASDQPMGTYSTSFMTAYPSGSGVAGTYVYNSGTSAWTKN